ncbi:hypothetical protein N8I77_005015 [Diaporthe amygdali]|uniref:Cytochrome P450 alkane hydroxylase n=1 Tax=Phomopsis amygdali TaxID=1214568 RepID=A0AAD9SMA5_PHOAM|nr:hypothetical protein N8I77_005015 [Diaporthe amygdali]
MARTPSSLTELAFAAAAVIALLFFASRASAFFSERKFRIENHCKSPPAYPQKDPVLALDLVFSALSSFRAKRFLDMVTERHTRVGTTYSARSMGRRYIFTTDPENIKTVLSVRFKDYCLGERSPIMGPLLGRGIFVTDGDEWSQSRAVLRPNFVKDQVADLSLVDKHIEDLLRLVRPHNGKTVDLAPLFMRFTLDSATEFLFNKSTNTLCNPGPPEQRFSEAFQISLNEIATLFRLGPFWRFRRTDPAVLEAHKVCRAYVDRFVNDAVILAPAKKPSLELDNHEDKQEQSNGSRNYFLKELAQTTTDKNKIRDELLNILIAGRDTAASLLSSLLHALARNPEMWAKVRNEVKQFNGERPQYEQLRDLKYSKHCINETLRLWPPVPSNMRVAVTDTVLPRGGGVNGEEPVHVPKGCAITYTVYAMHRRQDLFGPDADKFRPERWEEGQTYGWQYLPFNGGPRICLGQQYALTEALMVLTRFAQEFEFIEAKDPKQWTESLHLTVSPFNGVQVALTPVRR